MDRNEPRNRHGLKDWDKIVNDLSDSEEERQKLASEKLDKDINTSDEDVKNLQEDDLNKRIDVLYSIIQRIKQLINYNRE